MRQVRMTSRGTLARTAGFVGVVLVAASVLLSSIATARASGTAASAVEVSVRQKVTVAVTADAIVVRSNVPWQLTYADPVVGTRVMAGEKTADTRIPLPDGAHAVTIVAN